jgi:hypothetical protein
MTKLWKDVKEIIEKESEFHVAKECYDERTGDCIVDFVGGKYNGWSVVGKNIKAINEDDWDELVIDDEAIVYNPAE